MVPGVVCLYCGGAGDEVYTDPPEEELLLETGFLSLF